MSSWTSDRARGATLRGLGAQADRLLAPVKLAAQRKANSHRGQQKADAPDEQLNGPEALLILARALATLFV